MKRRSPRALALAAALLGAPHAAAAGVLEELTLARDLICAFNRSGPIVRPAPAKRINDDLMVVIEGIGIEPGAASVTSSRGVGAKAARVYATEARVHIVEDVNNSVVVTTVLACEAWKDEPERSMCRRFPAVIAWHFDRSVHVDPDRSFLGLPGSSYTGHCEPWNLE
jgi:hypothetical protein